MKQNQEQTPKESQIEYPIVYSEGYINQVTASIAVKLALWLETKTLSRVCFVPIMNGGYYFATCLLNQLNPYCGIAVKPVYVKSYDGQNRREIQLLRELPTFDNYDSVVLIDDVCDSGHTLEYVKSLFNAKVDVLTVVLLDKQVEGRVFIPDISAIRDPRPAWWRGCGMDDVRGGSRELPELVGEEPTKDLKKKSLLQVL